MTTAVSKLPSQFCDRGWHKLAIIIIFSLLLHVTPSLAYLPPAELSCTITAPKIHLKFCSLSFCFTLIPIFFSDLHRWIINVHKETENKIQLFTSWLFYLPKSTNKLKSCHFASALLRMYWILCEISMRFFLHGFKQAKPVMINYLFLDHIWPMKASWPVQEF